MSSDDVKVPACRPRCHCVSCNYGRPYVIQQAIIFWHVVSSFSIYLLLSSPNVSRRRLNVCHTSTHSVALVRIWNAGLKCAARGSLETQDPKNRQIRHLSTIAQICRAISSQLRHVSTIGKKLLNSTHHNMVNLGPLASEICWRVWSTPAPFNGFRVLAALLHGIQVVGISQTLRR